MELATALGIQRGDMVAFIGAGGKTSAMLRLGQELSEAGWRVLATTTTRMSLAERAAFPHAITRAELITPKTLSARLTQYGFVLLYEAIQNNKLMGLDPAFISELADQVDSDVILIEGDGSRRLPLKAPHPHEPVLPPDVTLVIPVAGLNVIGKRLNEDQVYNAARIIRHLGFPPNQAVQYPWLAQILRDDELGLQGIPNSARITVLLNQARPTMLERLKIRRTAQLILHNPRIQSVAIGQVQNLDPIWEVQKPIGAIVLAGGLSRRMGRSKPLLPWGDKTVIETILQRLLPLRLAEIVVVTGHQAHAVEAHARSLGVRTVHNPDYATGEMLSSLQTGLRALPDNISACMVFLGDQPQINPRLVNELLVAYAAGRGKIIAPSHQMRRGHPIIIDRRYWRELLALPKGSAPREVINAYPDEIAYVVTEDANVLNDMDTPEEYQAALKRAGLG